MKKEEANFMLLVCVLIISMGLFFIHNVTTTTYAINSHSEMEED